MGDIFDSLDIFDELAPDVAPFTGKQAVGSKEHRAAMEQWIRKEGKRNLVREVAEKTPIVRQLVEQEQGPYINPVYPQATVDRTLGKQAVDWQGKPVEGEQSLLGKAASVITAPIRGFESALAGGKAEQSLSGVASAPFMLPYQATRATLKDIQSPEGTPSELAKFGVETAKGLVAPVGLAGPSAFQEAWEEDPFGSYLLGKGAKSIVKKAGSKIADLAVEKAAPSSWEPAGAVTEAKPISRADKTQQRLDRIAAKSPKVIDNKIVNSAEKLIPPDRLSADPEMRASEVDGVITGVDNFQQLANEGAIFEHDAKGKVVFEPDGVTPKPYEVGKGGIVGAVKPAMQALKSIWDEVSGALNRSTVNGTTIQTKGVKGLEEFGGEAITPNQLQAKISELNEVLYKTKDGVLGIEDTIKRNEMKRNTEQLRQMLDSVVETGLSELGLRGLNQQWGGMRKFTDAILNGAELKLRGGAELNPSDIPVHGGPKYKAVGLATRYVNKFFRNPDKAFDTLIRARRAQGNKVRERYVDPTQDMPGIQRNPNANLGLEGGSVTPGKLTQEVNTGTEPPPVSSTQANLGMEGGKMTPGKVVEKVETGTEPTPKDLLATTKTLKAGLLATGKKGKAATTELAKQLGVPVAVLATWLLADDKKRKELALLPAFAGVMYSARKGEFSPYEKIPQAKELTAKVFGEQVPVIKNPTPSEINYLIEATQREYKKRGYNGGASDSVLRLAETPNGDMFVWDANSATHGQIMKDLGIKEGIEGHILLDPHTGEPHIISEQNPYTPLKSAKFRNQLPQPWKVPQQEVTSASTSISYPDVAAKSPVIFRAFKEGKIDVGPVNADIGGGRYNQITDFLATKNVENLVYDPFNRDFTHNSQVQSRLAGGGADTATVSNVLNVIPDEMGRLQTIATAYDSVKQGGKVYFSMYEAPKAGMVKGRDAYQVGKKAKEYIPEIEKVFGQGNVVQKGQLVIATKK